LSNGPLKEVVGQNANGRISHEGRTGPTRTGPVNSNPTISVGARRANIGEKGTMLWAYEGNAGTTV